MRSRDLDRRTAEAARPFNGAPAGNDVQRRLPVVTSRSRPEEHASRTITCPGRRHAISGEHVPSVGIEGCAGVVDRHSNVGTGSVIGLSQSPYRPFLQHARQPPVPAGHLDPLTSVINTERIRTRLGRALTGPKPAPPHWPERASSQA